jgi:hypothetical protein
VPSEPRPPQGPLHHAPTERGVAVIWAIAGLLIIVGTAFVGLQRLAAREAMDEAAFHYHGQALGVARSGLVDAIAWLRRQPDQPIVEFEPALDLLATPPVDETEDPAIGLVRTFELSGGLWARYEVRRGRPADPFTDANGNGAWDPGEAFVDLNAPAGPAPAGDLDDGYGDGAWTPAMWTRDVSGERGFETAGSVWRLEARGLVYRRPRGDLPLGAGANTLVSTAILATEVQRLTVAPPAAAALCVASPSGVTLSGLVRIRAPRLGVALASNYASLLLSGYAEVLAPLPHARIPDYRGTAEDVFGVDRTMLRSMADTSTSAALGGVPVPLPDGHLVVHDGSVVFDAAHPLVGRGLLVVHGNVEILADSGASFTGILFCDGDLEITAPATIRGTVVVTGRATLNGYDGKSVELVHDPVAVTDLVSSLGLYRVTRALYVPDARLLAPTALETTPPGIWPPPAGPDGPGAWGSWGGWEPPVPGP